MVRNAQKSQPDPRGGPANFVYAVQHSLLGYPLGPCLQVCLCDSYHGDNLSASRPVLVANTNQMFESMCLHVKSIHRSLEALRQLVCSALFQLPDGHGPTLLWTVTSLPSSADDTVILIIIDCFSKAVHFVAFPKLPSALETAQLLVDHFSFFLLPRKN